jgi:hypothetical protein
LILYVIYNYIIIFLHFLLEKKKILPIYFVFFRILGIFIMIYRILSFLFIVVIALSSTLHAGAGVLFMFNDGTVLVGIEDRGGQEVVSDFGGGQDTKDGGDNRRTALREGNEETAGTFGLKYLQVAGAPSVIHKHRVGSYQMFFVHISGRKPSIRELMKNKHAIEKKLGRRRAHVEKKYYKYVDAKALVNSAFGNGLLPGANIPLFGPFKACIKKDASNPRGALRNLINSPHQKAAPIRSHPVKAAPRPSPAWKRKPARKGRHGLRRKYAPKTRHGSRARHTSRRKGSR